MKESPAEMQSQVSSSSPPPAPEAPPSQPNVQLHLHIAWQSNLRITFTTSLLINYPSPMFMSLPIKLSVTGLVFNGEVVVAYEGEQRRIHLCVVDDLDPYGPLSGERQKRDTPSSSGTPAEQDEDLAPTQSRPSKPLPIGQRLLPNIFIESEIGQADKHVLKNVTRVERFIQDVIRKTVEEELVFPNFHTLVLPDQS
jgi:mitochondrial distribution and morphology protein 12